MNDNRQRSDAAAHGDTVGTVAGMQPRAADAPAGAVAEPEASTGPGAEIAPPWRGIPWLG